MIEYGQNDSVGISLDYSNTICDTLFYDNRTILLETSPLLQLNEISPKVNNIYEQSYDSIYNCARGYTATWKLEGKRLFLLSVHQSLDADKWVKKIMGLKQFKDISKKPVEASWVTGKITGGADAVKTNYGYAFKQEYEFELSKGALINETVNAFPVGLLEKGQELHEFLKKNSNTLLNVFFHFDKFKSFRNVDTTLLKNSFAKEKIPLIADLEGETYYAPKPSIQGFTVHSISLDKSIDSRLWISHMNFANMLPKGSFYPRFLRNGVIYQPINIEYSWNLYGDIENVSLQYYNVPKKLILPNWRIVGTDEPK